MALGMLLRFLDEAEILLLTQPFVILLLNDDELLLLDELLTARPSAAIPAIPAIPALGSDTVTSVASLLGLHLTGVKEECDREEQDNSQQVVGLKHEDSKEREIRPMAPPP